MKLRESALSITAVFSTALLIFALASVTPATPVAVADGGIGGGPIPADTVGDTLSDPMEKSNPDDGSILDEFLEILDEIF